MTDSENTTTLPVSRRRLLAGAASAATVGTVAATVARAVAAPAIDTPLFDLCRRWREMEPIIARLSDEYEELHRMLPSRQWTPEELKAHRIDGEKDQPRYISLKDLENNDRWDSPTYPKCEYDTQDDGTTMVQMIKTIRRTATEEEMEAWRGRCAARRALYDAKDAARDEAYRASGAGAAKQRLEAAYDERDRLWDEIKAYRPLTVAGVLEKMRLFREADGDNFDGEPDELNWTAALFLATLADLEGMVGGAA